MTFLVQQKVFLESKYKVPPLEEISQKRIFYSII